MDDKNVPTAEIEIIGANGSLGDWVVSDWTSDAAMIAALQQSYAQQLGAHMAQKIVGDLTQPQFIFAGGKKFTFALAAGADLFSIFAEAVEGDAHGL